MAGSHWSDDIGDEWDEPEGDEAESEADEDIGTEVTQGKIKVRFYSNEDAGPLFYTEGMNPCIGIVLCGQINGKYNFVALNHYDVPTDTTNICLGTLKEMLSKVDNKFKEFTEEEIRTISLTKSYLIRCTQETPDQNQSANINAKQLVKALDHKDQAIFKKLMLENKSEKKLNYDYVIASDYRSTLFEEKEIGDTSSMECYISVNKDGSLFVDPKLFVLDLLPPRDIQLGAGDGHGLAHGSSTGSGQSGTSRIMSLLPVEPVPEAKEVARIPTAASDPGFLSDDGDSDMTPVSEAKVDARIHAAASSDPGSPSDDTDSDMTPVPAAQEDAEAPPTPASLGSGHGTKRNREEDPDNKGDQPSSKRLRAKY